MDYHFHHLKLASGEIYLLEFREDFDSKKYLDILTDSEKERFFAFGNTKRQQEFVATRILKHDLFGYSEIKYREHGAPFLEDEGFISISHAKNLVGIASHPKHAIGFDIEEIHPKVLKLCQKFLNEQERLIFNTLDTEEMITCWSFKESLYKLAGRKLIDFKKDLLLLEKDANACKAKIINPNEVIYVDLEAIRFKNFIITINSHAAKYVQN